jgi:hypothetical protein
MSIIRSVRLQITAYGMVSWCCGGLAVRRAAAWSYVLGVKEDAWDPPSHQAHRNCLHWRCTVKHKSKIRVSSSVENCRYRMILVKPVMWINHALWCRRNAVNQTFDKWRVVRCSYNTDQSNPTTQY